VYCDWIVHCDGSRGNRVTLDVPTWPALAMAAGADGAPQWWEVVAEVEGGAAHDRGAAGSRGQWFNGGGSGDDEVRVLNYRNGAASVRL
jgi:hypothetical protein